MLLVLKLVWFPIFLATTTSNHQPRYRRYVIRMTQLCRSRVCLRALCLYRRDINQRRFIQFALPVESTGGDTACQTLTHENSVGF